VEGCFYALLLDLLLSNSASRLSALNTDSVCAQERRHSSSTPGGLTHSAVPQAAQAALARTAAFARTGEFPDDDDDGALDGGEVAGDGGGGPHDSNNGGGPLEGPEDGGGQPVGAQAPQQQHAALDTGTM
jgi:hypothetical protein